MAFSSGKFTRIPRRRLKKISDLQINKHVFKTHNHKASPINHRLKLTRSCKRGTDWGAGGRKEGGGGGGGRPRGKVGLVKKLLRCKTKNGRQPGGGGGGVRPHSD